MLWTEPDLADARPEADPLVRPPLPFLRFGENGKALRPTSTEELPGVAAHDSLFVLLRPGVAVPSRARTQNYPTQQNKQRIVRGYSWQLFSVDLAGKGQLCKTENNDMDGLQVRSIKIFLYLTRLPRDDNFFWFYGPDFQF